MTRGRTHCAALALLAGGLLAACTDDPDDCGVRGGTQACTCTDGRSGAQLCLPEGAWDDCECSGALGDGAVGGDGGGADAAAARSDASASGGSGGAAASDDDAGAAPTPATGDAAAAGVDAAIGVDAGVDGGQAGSGGGVDAAVPAMPYATCASDGDCTGGACRQTTDLLLGMLGVCAPDCQSPSDCPMPAGSYDSTLACESGQCRLDCAPVFPLPFARSCPGGMVCRAEGLLQSCYAN